MRYLYLWLQSTGLLFMSVSMGGCVHQMRQSTTTFHHHQLACTTISHSDIKSALQSRAACTVGVHMFNTEIDSLDHRPEENGMMLDVHLDEHLAIRDHEEAEAEGVPTVSGTYFRTRNNLNIYWKRPTTTLDCWYGVLTSHSKTRLSITFPMTLSVTVVSGTQSMISHNPSTWNVCVCQSHPLLMPFQV